MLNFKIIPNDLLDMDKLKHVFFNIFKWNNNKDIMLWAYNSESFIIPDHYKVIYPFSINFDSKKPYKTICFSNNIDYINFLEFTKNYDYNIFISKLYLEDIKEEYITIKSGKYENRNTIFFEIHKKAIGNNLFINKFKKLLEKYIEENDFMFYN